MTRTPAPHPAAPRTTKRVAAIRSFLVGVGAPVDIKLEKGVNEFSVAVVDATTFVPVAWTLAYESDPANVRHFTAGSIYSELTLGARFGPLTLTIGAAVAARVELIVWKA